MRYGDAVGERSDPGRPSPARAVGRRVGWTRACRRRALPPPGRDGLVGAVAVDRRPRRSTAPDATGAPGVFVCGDWVGDEGLLVGVGGECPPHAGRLAACARPRESWDTRARERRRPPSSRPNGSRRGAGLRAHRDELIGSPIGCSAHGAMPRTSCRRPGCDGGDRRRRDRSARRLPRPDHGTAPRALDLWVVPIAERETYVGPWLPEPASLGPARRDGRGRRELTLGSSPCCNASARSTGRCSCSTTSSAGHTPTSPWPSTERTGVSTDRRDARAACVRQAPALRFGRRRPRAARPCGRGGPGRRRRHGDQPPRRRLRAGLRRWSEPARRPGARGRRRSGGAFLIGIAVGRGERRDRRARWSPAGSTASSACSS